MDEHHELDQPAKVHWFRGEHSSADASWGEASRDFPTLSEALDFARTGLPEDARGPFVTTASGQVLKGDQIGAARPALSPSR